MKKSLVKLTIILTLCVASSLQVLAADPVPSDQKATNIPYIDVLQSLAENAESHNTPVEISELKRPAEQDEYDKVIIEANKQSSSKFIRTIGIENKISIEEFKAAVDQEVQRSSALEKYIAYRQLAETSPVSSADIYEPFAVTATKNITKTASNDSRFEITATCSGSSTISVSDAYAQASFLGSVLGYFTYGSGQTFSTQRLDAGRTRGVTVWADVNSPSIGVYRGQFYAEFYASEL